MTPRSYRTAAINKREKMRYSQSTFDQAVWKIVANIKPGHVMGYGEVARAAGFPRHARFISKAMSRSQTSLPWHRVVKSDRTLAFEAGSEPYKKQRALLEMEGVQIVAGKVIPRKSDNAVDLDKLLWGPGS